jgi:hypothetical protein
MTATYGFALTPPTPTPSTDAIAVERGDALPHVGEWEITFTLAAGFTEEDAFELYERLERHPAVSGAVLAGRP